jgi:NAD(P)-dependent dehydrogenase (short-subunit alcohol dehydrogenase family)
MNVRLDGRAALVTGAGEGIGRACALSLAAAGADVFVNDKNPTTGEDTAAQIRASGGRAHFLAADVSVEREVVAMFHAVALRTRALHVLVNNAGFNLFKGIQETSLAEWESVFKVDSTGVYLVTKNALPLLKAAQDASVINIASVHASLTVPDMTAYAAAKGAVLAMGRSLAQELGPLGIRVNTVSPGFMDTPLLRRWVETQEDQEATMRRINGYHPLGRIGRPKDIGNLVVFLAGEESSFITGANILIDGGLTTRLMH